MQTQDPGYTSRSWDSAAEDLDVLSQHLKMDKTKVLMEKGSLMFRLKILQNAPLEHSEILSTFISDSDLY